LPGTTYDIAIAGAGAAGLTLAYKLLNSSLRNKKILIIDKSDKDVNDRTWCFWTDKKTGFESIVFRKWSRVLFKNKRQQKVLDMHPYEYQMIRGIDFYNYIKDKIKHHRNVDWITDEIIATEDINGHVEISTEKSTFKSLLAFNSIPAKTPDFLLRKNNFLLQHFKGFIIQTASDVFDPETPCLMDFSVKQHGETRFGYILPFSSNEGLVEFTIFSDKLLKKGNYDELLANYLHHHLGINEYTIKEEEFGVIPMTDHQPDLSNSKKIIPIGTRGGMTKASTGYTFKNILDECSYIVEQLETGSLNILSTKKRFKFYDSILLHVLSKDLLPADEIFSDLFLKNDPKVILKFLDEKTTMTEDLQILGSLPALPFIKGLWFSLFSMGKKKISIEPE